jgi:hypothetical protein
VKEFERLPPPPLEAEIEPSEREDYEWVLARTRRVHGLEGQAATYFGALLQTPPLARVLSDFGTRVRLGQTRGTYSDAERELMDIAMATDLGSNAILPIHIPDAFAVGVRAGALRALIERRDQDLEPAERKLVEYARAFSRGEIDDEAYEQIERRLGRRGAVEFNVLLGFLLMTIRLWQALGLPEPNDHEVGALLAEMESDPDAHPDPTARIG